MTKGLERWVRFSLIALVESVVCLWPQTNSMFRPGLGFIITQNPKYEWSLGQNGKRYMISDHAMPFYDAKDFCTNQDSNLAQIRNKLDQQAIEDVTTPERAKDGTPLWLGLYETTGIFHSEWSWLKRNFISGSSNSYDNWENSDARFGDPLRDCGAMSRDGTWIIKNCDAKAKALCESAIKEGHLTGAEQKKLNNQNNPQQNKPSGSPDYAKKPAWKPDINKATDKPTAQKTPSEKWTSNVIYPNMKTNNPKAENNVGSSSSGEKADNNISTNASTSSGSGTADSNQNSGDDSQRPLSGQEKNLSQMENSTPMEQNTTTLPSLLQLKPTSSEVRCALLNFLNHFGKPVKILRVVNDRAAKSISFNESNYKLKTIFKRIANVRRMKPVEYYAVADKTGEQLLLDGMNSLPLIPGDCEGEFMDVVIASKEGGKIENEDGDFSGSGGKGLQTPTPTPSPATTASALSTLPFLNFPSTKAPNASESNNTTERRDLCKLRTFGGNVEGDCCKFPFKYENIMYYDCTRANSHHLWCGTSHNYDRDAKWGYCCVEGDCS